MQRLVCLVGKEPVCRREAGPVTLDVRHGIPTCVPEGEVGEGARGLQRVAYDVLGPRGRGAVAVPDETLDSERQPWDSISKRDTGAIAGYATPYLDGEG